MVGAAAAAWVRAARGASRGAGLLLPQSLDLPPLARSPMGTPQHRHLNPRRVDKLPQATLSAPALQIPIYQTPGAEVEWAPDNATLAAARAAAAAPAAPRIDAQWYSRHW